MRKDVLEVRNKSKESGILDFSDYRYPNAKKNPIEFNLFNKDKDGRIQDCSYRKRRVSISGKSV